MVGRIGGIIVYAPDGIGFWRGYHYLGIARFVVDGLLGRKKDGLIRPTSRIGEIFKRRAKSVSRTPLTTITICGRTVADNNLNYVGRSVRCN
jgi:hypothetical protein